MLFGYLAAVTSLELVTGIIILPQRQTALVAKQAAEVDLLTGGRFRLGVGLGWNAVEYEALGKDFTNRGRRVEEQVELLRRLWTEPSGHLPRHATSRSPAPGSRRCRCSGRSRCGSAASHRRAYRRAGRLADGWFPQVPPGPQLDEARAIVEQAAVAAGRDPAALGMEGRVSWTGDAGPAGGPGRPLASRPAPPTCRSTPWAPGCPPSTRTWPRSSKPPRRSA